jgi:hypothetical protein
MYIDGYLGGITLDELVQGQRTSGTKGKVQ